MLGKPHDIDNSFSYDCEKPTRGVEEREFDLRTLVLKYEVDLRELKMKMALADQVPGELCKKNVQLWDDEINTLNQFIKELLNGAHEIL